MVKVWLPWTDVFCGYDHPTQAGETRRMNRTLRTFVAPGLMILSMVGFAAPAVKAQDNGLDEVRRRQQVADQALEARIAEAMKAAAELANDPARAVEILKKVRAELEAVGPESTLSFGQRFKLKTALDERIKAIESGKPRPAPGAEKPKGDTGEKEKEAELRRDLDIVKFLKDQGKLDEARGLAAALAERFPNHPAVTAAASALDVGSAVKSDADLAKAQKAGNVAALRDIGKSTIIPKDDYNLPPDWAEKSAKRKAAYAQRMNPMTDKERAIQKTLDQITRQPVSFAKTPWDDVLKTLEEVVGLPLLVNKQTLDEAKASYDLAITKKLPQGITKRYLLKAVLAELDLTFIIKNEQIQIVTILQAQTELVTRVIPIDDLFLSGSGNSTTPQGIIDFIMETVDPLSWKKNNGPGTITYYPAGRCIIVRNTAEVVNKLMGK